MRKGKIEEKNPCIQEKKRSGHNSVIQGIAVVAHYRDCGLGSQKIAEEGRTALEFQNIVVCHAIDPV